MTSTVETRYRVQGMDCASCAAKIEAAAGKMPGVDALLISAVSGMMTIRHDGNEEALAAVERKIAGLGYRLDRVTTSADRHPPRENDAPRDHGSEGEHHDDDAHHHEHEVLEGLHGHDHTPTTGPWWKSAKGRLTIASGLAISAAFIVSRAVPESDSWIFILAMLVGLVPIARRALMAAFAGIPFSIEMLMTIAAVGAVFIGASHEAATVVFLFLIGELLEGVAAGKARASIQSLTKLVPKTAFLEEAGATREVPAETLAVGATILIRPGDRIPADGVVISGESAVDEAPVTGESTPVRKTEQANLFAGTVNGEGALRVRVTASAADNTIARVIKLVEEAQESKAPTERFIDRFSRFYTPGVVLVGALVAVLPPLVLGASWSGWIYKGLAILLIGCPCALVISTPAAIAASLSAGARRGLLLKGGAVLESLGKTTAVALDKTGTLTLGKPQVTDILAFALPEAEVLRMAAALEAGSSHPLASAILDRARADKVELPSVADGKAIGGEGVTGTVDGQVVFLGSPQAASTRSALNADQLARIEALNDEGKTVSVVIMGGEIAGAIAMRDEPRADAQAGLDALRSLGIKTVMLTGDNRRTADAVGKLLGIEARGELLPQDKQRIIKELQAEGFKVVKVGDGINDAPALAAADVGIAMGGGTDVALETADAAILHGRVSDVASMIALSKRTMANIGQNITMALGLKAVFLVTTVIGVTGLWPAILADTGATVLVTLNALRLLRPPPAVQT